MTFENLRNETKTKYIVGSLSHFVIVIGYGPIIYKQSSAAPKWLGLLIIAWYHTGFPGLPWLFAWECSFPISFAEIICISFVVMGWVVLGSGSVGVVGGLARSRFIRNPCSFGCRLYNSSSSCRTSVPSSLRVDGIWLTIDSGHSCSLTCWLLRFFFWLGHRRKYRCRYFKGKFC